jgi:putative restriction endonuclease
MDANGKGIRRSVANLRHPNRRKRFAAHQILRSPKSCKETYRNSQAEKLPALRYEPKTHKTVRETTVRVRGFRQAVNEIYDFRCAVCGLKINSPDSLCWEVEAAHIVPHGSFGRDDLFNGIALCRFHHWAFDVGWFALLDNYKICVSSKLAALPREFGRVGDYELIRALTQSRSEIRLPSRQQVYPHINSLSWHRQFVFHQ